MGRIDGTDKIPDIATAGLNRLEFRGIQCILEESGINVNLIPVEEFRADFEADVWLITPDILSASVEFFLSHKESTVVLCREKPDSSPFFTIYHDMPDSEIVDTFKSAAEAALREDDKSGRLSSREADVLRLIAKGLTIKEIGDRLCISANTVATHRKNISAKLGIRTISGLSLYAAMNGMIND